MQDDLDTKNVLAFVMVTKIVHDILSSCKLVQHVIGPILLLLVVERIFICRNVINQILSLQRVVRLVVLVLACCREVLESSFWDHLAED